MVDVLTPAKILAPPTLVVVTRDLVLLVTNTVAMVRLSKCSYRMNV